MNLSMLHKSLRENNATKQIAEQLIFLKKANALKTTCCHVKIMFRYFAEILGYVKMHFLFFFMSFYPSRIFVSVWTYSEAGLLNHNKTALINFERYRVTISIFVTKQITVSVKAFLQYYNGHLHDLVIVNGVSVSLSYPH